MRTVFNEWVGAEIPVTLNNLMKRNNVTPADIYMFEGMGWTYKMMESHIKRHSPDGMYRMPYPLNY